MSADPDRLYHLLPVVYRLRDAEQGYPLRALLQVITEQVELVEADIAQLHENWFIETCQDWVVPYIGALIGYQPLVDTAQLANPGSVRGLAEERLLIPRQEVANTIRFRRRKGTLSLLQDLAAAVGGWPSHAVEFYRLLGVTQNIRFLQADRGRTAELRDGDALDELDGPFDELARSVDVRRVNSARSRGRPNIAGVGLFVWRLRAYSVTRTPAYCYEEVSPNCYLFSALGNDSELFCPGLPMPAALPASANAPALPGPIRRRRLAQVETSEARETTVSGVPWYYGPGRSFEIWVGPSRQPVDASQIVAADLSDWTYRPLPNTVAVDPRLGRIAFPPAQSRRQGVWVSYFYGFSADIGGGEYARTLEAPAQATTYRVGAGEALTRIGDALAEWQQAQPRDAVIEISDSGLYVEPINIVLAPAQSLQIRAASGRRPIIRLPDWQGSQPGDLTVTGAAESMFTLDGLLITGRAVQVDGSLAGVTIRHCTLVPGWGLQCDCTARRPAEPSLDLINAPTCLRIEHSIVGAIQVDRDEVRLDPLIIRISDSLVDATNLTQVALGAPESLCAHATLTILRSTVLGQVQTHAIALAENTLFMGSVLACRRQQGCIRFCYLPPGARTPRRFECQPDLVDQSVAALFHSGAISATQRDALQRRERLRVLPQFNSLRYGTPAYGQLAGACAREITQGADDASELGVFHDLFQPQRIANLQARLNEYAPAGMDAGIIFAS